jgi:hypothetical protein
MSSPHLRGHLGAPRLGQHARVVDQDVDAAPGLHARVDGTVGRGFVADVAHGNLGPHAGVAAAARHVFHPRAVEIGQQQAGAGVRVGQRNGRADAAAGAGHHGAASLQKCLVHVGSLAVQSGQRTVRPPSAITDWPVM